MADRKHKDTLIKHIDLSSTGEKLAIAQGGTVTVLDPMTGEKKFVQNYKVPVSKVAFCRNDLLAASAGNEITVWDSNTWDEKIQFETTSDVTGLQFCCYHEVVCHKPLLLCCTKKDTGIVFDLENDNRISKFLHKSVQDVAWMGFRHESVVSAGGRRVHESSFDDSRCEVTYANRFKAASDFLATPHQPSGEESLIHGDDQGYIYKNHQLDYAAIGSSLISANQRTIEYHLPQIGRLGKRRIVGNSISSLSWVGNFPLNFATGDHKGKITIWAIKIVPRSFLTRSLSKSSTVSGAIFHPVVEIQGHPNTVTALAYPSVKRAFQNQLLASGCTDGTVRLWEINNAEIRERAADNAKKSLIVAGSYAMALNGTPHQLAL